MLKDTGVLGRQRKIARARAELAGARGLVAAIIAQAYVDYLGNDQAQKRSAAAYFRGAVYRQHLVMLGLPADMLPEEVRKSLHLKKAQKFTTKKR